MKPSFLFLWAFLLGSCTTWKPVIDKKVHASIGGAEVERALHQEAVVTLQGYYPDGSSVIFKEGWVVVDSVVEGFLIDVSALGVQKREDFVPGEVHVADVELWRTSRKLTTAERAVFGGTWFLVALDAGVGVFCLVNPKACFGSCPTFYQGNAEYLFHSDAEGFTHAIVPSLEHRDIDALPQLLLPGREQLTMKNEALETHNVRSVELLTAPFVEGTEVVHAVDDAFYRTSKGPRAQASFQGTRLSAVEQRDGQEWFLLSDPDDLAHKVRVDVSVPEARTGVRYGLKLTYRQSLMSTYLFYGTLDMMGDDYGRRMVRMNHSNWQKKWLMEDGIMQYLGGIQVLDAKGKELGNFNETGPIALNTQILPLEGWSGGALTLQLTQGLWRIDHLEVVEIREEIQPDVRRIVRVQKNGQPAPEATAQLLNPEAHLVSLPGDQWVLTFEGVSEPSHVFLASEGYYHEWTRKTWYDEGAPRQLNHLLLHPRQFLRDEAAAYKVYESEMEPLFWSSKVQSPILTSHED